MRSMFLALTAFSVITVGLLGRSMAKHETDADLCFVDVHTNLYGNPQVPCDYRFTMTVNPDGTIASTGDGTRECFNAGVTGLGAGTGTVGDPSSIVFPFIADVTFNLPPEGHEGRWVTGRVLTLSDRGGSSPVTSSLMICADTPR